MYGTPIYVGVPRRRINLDWTCLNWLNRAMMFLLFRSSHLCDMNVTDATESLSNGFMYCLCYGYYKVSCEDFHGCYKGWNPEKVWLIRRIEWRRSNLMCSIKISTRKLEQGSSLLYLLKFKDNFQDTYVRTPSGSWGRSAAVAATALCRPGGSGACRPATVPLAPWAYLRRKWSTPRGSTCAHGCKKNFYSYRF